MAADYSGGQGLEVRLNWPEDTGKEPADEVQPSDPAGVPDSAAVPSQIGAQPATSPTADTMAAWLPAIDARLGELIVSTGRLEATSRTLSRLEGALAELLDRVSALEQLVDDRLAHVDDRLEYLAGSGAIPVASSLDGGSPGPGLGHVSAQLDSLTNEVSALRRRLAVRSKGDRA